MLHFLIILMARRPFSLRSALPQLLVIASFLHFCTMILKISYIREHVANLPELAFLPYISRENATFLRKLICITYPPTPQMSLLPHEMTNNRRLQRSFLDPLFCFKTGFRPWLNDCVKFSSRGRSKVALGSIWNDLASI